MNKLPVLNLFGGPGVGKSRHGVRIVARMQDRGIPVALVTEYAKELVYRKDYHTLKCQPYVTVTQLRRQYDVAESVQAIVTDSPIILGELYGGLYCTETFYQWIAECFHNDFRNFNVLLTRNPSLPYEQVGRYQSESEAKSVDEKLRKVLSKRKIHYIEVMSSDDSERIISDEFEKFFRAS